MGNTNQPATSSIFGIPINRIVAFVGPYISLLSGAVVTWLFAHLHFLSLFHTTNTAASKTITQLAIFVLTSGLVWLGHQKWLDGWQKWEQMILGNVIGNKGLGADLGVWQQVSDADEFKSIPPESATVPDNPEQVTGISDSGAGAAPTPPAA